jgi:hypothetical protein
VPSGTKSAFINAEKRFQMSINNSIWRPSWWAPKNHGVAWDLVKTSLRRDWEKSKHDFQLGGHELKQDVAHSVRQGAGAAPTPKRQTAGAKSRALEWHTVETPYGYGYSARQEFGHLYPLWDPYIEDKLYVDWISPEHDSPDDWSEIGRFVRHGYEAHKKTS